MPLYTFDASNVEEQTSATEIVLQIIILRDGEPASTIFMKYPIGWTNQQARAATVARLQDFVRVDADRIAQDDATARAEAFANVIDGWQYDSESL